MQWSATTISFAAMSRMVIFNQNSLLLTSDRNLAPAIKKSDEFRVKMSQFPPITSGKHRETKSFAALMDETIGFMD